MNAQFANDEQLKAERRVPSGARCQEASVLSIVAYVPCDAPATTLVDNGDRQPYWMCERCADHNVTNRGGKVLARLDNPDSLWPIDPRD